MCPLEYHLIRVMVEGIGLYVTGCRARFIHIEINSYTLGYLAASAQYSDRVGAVVHGKINEPQSFLWLATGLDFGRTSCPCNFKFDIRQTIALCINYVDQDVVSPLILAGSQTSGGPFR